MNYFTFANVMNNLTIISIFKSDNNNITGIKTQHGLIITIANKTLKFKPVIKIPIVVTIHYLLLSLSAGSVPSLNQLYYNRAFIRLKKQIRIKYIFIKITYHFCVYNFISRIV